MKIAMIGQKGIPATFGGVETAVEHLSAALVARGHQVIVYCRANYTPPTTPRTYRGIELRILPSVPTKHFDALSHTAFSLLDLIHRDVDLVHIHSVGPASLAPFARLIRLPTVVTIHAADWLRAKWSLPARFCLRRSLDIAVRSAHVLTTVSLSMVAFLADTYGVEAVHIPNGVSSQSAASQCLLDRLGLSRQRFILFAGRLVPEKDPHVLLEAFQNLIGQTRFADTHLLIAGDSGFSDSYVTKLHRLAGPNTHFLGVVSPADLAGIYQQAAVCVLPSHLEGMSLVLLEAASYACPVIAADIPQNRDTLDNFANYFSPRSSPSLQDTLADVLDNPTPARQLARLSREHVTREFSWPKIAQRMEEAYLCAVRLAQSRR